MRVAFLPLDTRPCCRSQVEELALIGSISLRTLPANTIAFEKMAEWLDAALPGCDAAVISTDRWLYGGLVESRKMHVSPQEAFDRLKQLRALMTANPGVRFYLSSVLLRLSTTIDAHASEQVWRNVFEYFVLSESGSQETLAALEAEIPTEILQEFKQARARNHSLSLALLDLGSEVSSVVYGQEDCAPQGIHRLEKARLKESLSKLPPDQQKRIQIMTGADELGSLLLMQAFMDHRGIQPGTVPLQVFASDAKGLDLISRYEDISVRENLELHFKNSPFKLTYRQSDGADDSADDETDRLAIFTFESKGQGDLCFEPQPLVDARAAKFVSKIEPGDAILDVSYANGASRALAEALLSKMHWEEIGAFSAWNTTGNRLGTLVAHLGMRLVAQKSQGWNPVADRCYLVTRLIDDFLYQSCVRPELQSYCNENGINPWALGDSWEQVSQLAKTKLQAIAREFRIDVEFSAALTWPRVFEVETTQTNADQK